MNKRTVSFVIAAVLLALLATTGMAYAQAGNPPVQASPAYGQGGGRGPGGNAQGGRMGSGLASTQDGILHDELIAIVAGKLGLTVDTVNTRLAGGETLAEIAAAQGYTAEQFNALMVDARSQAVEQAVASGELTQEQADWMQSRGARMGGGARGAGQGRMTNPSCPYNTTTP